jgi:hypothetical protein
MICKIMHGTLNDCIKFSCKACSIYADMLMLIPGGQGPFREAASPPPTLELPQNVMEPEGIIPC